MAAEKAEFSQALFQLSHPESPRILLPLHIHEHLAVVGLNIVDFLRVEEKILFLIGNGNLVDGRKVRILLRHLVLVDADKFLPDNLIVIPRTQTGIAVGPGQGNQPALIPVKTVHPGQNPFPGLLVYLLQRVNQHIGGRVLQKFPGDGNPPLFPAAAPGNLFPAQIRQMHLLNSRGKQSPGVQKIREIIQILRHGKSLIQGVRLIHHPQGSLRLQRLHDCVQILFLPLKVQHIGLPHQFSQFRLHPGLPFPSFFAGIL